MTHVSNTYGAPDLSPLLSARERQSSSQNGSQNGSQSGSQSGQSILIVDDTPQNLRILSDVLGQRGYEVRQAISGNMALVSVQTLLPDLILLDIMMPEMDGYEVCRRLKEDPRTRKVPIIFLSALSATEEKVKAFSMGASDYVTKPFHFEEIVARIEHQLKIRQLQRRLAEQNRLLSAEKKKAEDLLRNILPEAIADKLKDQPNNIDMVHTAQNLPLAESFESATILFADIVNFTRMADQVSPQKLVRYLNHIFSRFDRLTEKYELEKIKTIGDAYMVAGGIPVERADHADAIADFALDMQSVISQFEVRSGTPFQLRIGVNTGPVIAGVIGLKKFSYDLWGDAVNVASRMESQGEPGRIQVTQSTYEALRDRYSFERRGTLDIKGKGQMNTYWLTGKCP